MAPKVEDGASMGSGETVKKNSIGNDALIPNAGQVHIGKFMICVASVGRSVARSLALFHSHSFSVVLHNSQNPVCRGAVG